MESKPKISFLSLEEAARRAKAELTYEASLFGLARSFYKHCLRFDVNIWASIVAFAVFFSSAAVLEDSVVSRQIREVTDLFLTLFVTSYGFLLAGITLVATITKPAYFTKLARCLRSGNDISELKFMLLLFFYTAFAFIFYIIALVLLRVIGVDFMYKIGRSFPVIFIDAELYHRVAYAVICTLAVYMCLLLKSLAWNLYTVYTDVILVDFEEV